MFSSVAQSLASLQHLQALRLTVSNENFGDCKPMAMIKNLKHLSIEDNLYAFGCACNYGRSILTEDRVVRSILLNSRSTLESLCVKTRSVESNFLYNWQECSSEDESLTTENYYLAALKSLTLSGITLDADFVESFRHAIKFSDLEAFTLIEAPNSKAIFFNCLIGFSSGASNLKLENLTLEMHQSRWARPAEEHQEEFEAICRFISSFDTLRTLELKEYGQYPSNTATNPGLPQILLRAIIKHRKLQRLKITYRGITCGYKVPYLSAETVAFIVDNLSDLREFSFAPVESEIVGCLLMINITLIQWTNMTTG